MVTAAIGDDTLIFSDQNKPRELLVFIGRPNHSFDLLFRNLKAFPCGGCCGMTDPYAGIVIKNGQIIINEYCASNWKSISEYRFRYEARLNDWLLDTLINESYAFDHEDEEIDTTTRIDFGKVSLRNFVIEKDNP